MNFQIFITVGGKIVNTNHVLFIDIKPGICILTLTNNSVLKTEDTKEISLIRKYLTIVSQ